MGKSLWKKNILYPLSSSQVHDHQIHKKNNFIKGKLKRKNIFFSLNTTFTSYIQLKRRKRINFYIFIPPHLKWIIFAL